MPLPPFGAEASLARSRGHYQGAYRYGVRPGGVQPNQLYTAEADGLAYTDMTDLTAVDEEVAGADVALGDGADLGEAAGIGDDAEIELEEHELDLEAGAAEVGA